MWFYYDNQVINLNNVIDVSKDNTGGITITYISGHYRQLAFTDVNKTKQVFDAMLTFIEENSKLFKA
jgi:hypothetical protein